MLAKLGPLVSEVAGSIGGTTFQRSPHGTVIRSKPLGIKRQSTYSSSARQRMATVNALWAIVPALDKIDWDTFAATQSWFNRFGDPITGTGYMAFLKQNLANLSSRAGVYPIAVSKFYPTTTNGTLPADPEFIYDLATDRLYLNSTDANTDANTFIATFASRPVAGGNRVNYRPKPFLARVGATAALPFELTTNYTDLWGRLPDKTVLEPAYLRVQAYDAANYYPALDVVLPLVYK